MLGHQQQGPLFRVFVFSRISCWAINSRVKESSPCHVGLSHVGADMHCRMAAKTMYVPDGPSHNGCSAVIEIGQ